MTTKPPTWICTTEDKPWTTRTASETTTTAEPNLRLTGGEGQVWRGFGGCFNELGYRSLIVLDPAARDEILADLFAPDGGCQFSLARTPIGASDYAESWYSLNEHDGDLTMEKFSIERDRRLLIPYIQAALEQYPALELFGSPWSPPAWMKFPAVCNFGTLRWEPEILDAYALYFLKYVRAYREAGMEIRQVHVQNEPNSDQKFPSCVWTGPKMRDFIRDHLGPLFEREGETCEIWAGTIEREDYDAWANTILSDEKARRYIHGVGYQWAGKGAVQRTHQSWPDVPISQTENECGDGQNTWEYAHYVFGLLHHYITNGASAYYYWNMVLAPEGRSSWGWKQNSMITIDPETRAVTRNPEYYVIKHCSQFIRPGAVRLDVTGYWAANTLAFRDVGQCVTLVVRNPLAETSPFVFAHGGAKIEADLPARSVNTFRLFSRE
jgi:glucosylceramidase